LGAYAGRRITRRATAPLADTALAARQVAEGDLAVRLPNDAPHSEVATLASAFNEMVEQLVQRLDRDARFASDVSHELRSPLTTLAMSAEVLRLHESELHPDAREALTLLTTDIATFQSLVEDLLDIAKSDSGSDTMVREVLPINELVTQCVLAATRRHQLPVTPQQWDSTDGLYVSVDRRRFDRQFVVRSVRCLYFRRVHASLFEDRRNRCVDFVSEFEGRFFCDELSHFLSFVLARPH
jgi:signal transduction histidine kinase